MPIPVPGRVVEVLRRSTAAVRSGNSRREGTGSAIVIAGDRVITNAHVIHGTELMVESWEGKTVSARIVRLDRFRDLALLEAPGLNALPAPLGDSDQVRAGTAVVAVGNPLGFTGALSSGTVHAVGRMNSGRGGGAMGGPKWIFADVRLAPGNSGGPLANWQGHVIGVNTMVMAGGLAVAIPSRAVQAFLARVNSTRSLGVTVRPVSTRDGSLGMLILELFPDGAAERASLLPGDMLTGTNGQKFESVEDLQLAIDEVSTQTLTLDFIRGGEQKTRHVVARLVPEPATSAA
jgi:serine protease Do